MAQTDTSASPSQRPGDEVERRGLLARVLLFYRQVVSEMRKVVWPTRTQLITYTVVVIVFVAVSVAFLTGIDSGFSWVVLKLFG